MSTPDQKVAEQIGRSLDGRIASLQNERRMLLLAATRIDEIDAEIVILEQERIRVQPRRVPPVPGPIVNQPPVRTPQE